MTDDEIADRIVKMIRSTLANLRSDPMFFSVEATNIMDVSEGYGLAFIEDAGVRAGVKRDQKRIRRLVFAKLGVGDRREVEKQEGR